MPSSPDPDLQLALDAARGAVAILRGWFGKGLPVTYKSRDQPVTEADREADRFLRDALCGPRPTYGWLSEELPPAAARGDRPRIWVVDPLDGTTSFVRGRPEFAVSIGLLEGETPVLGVVCNPMTGEIFHAERGSGAFRAGERIRVSATPADRAVLVASPTELARGALRGFVGRWTVEPLGSTALKMVRVAEGRADAYVSAGRKDAWDVCAGMVIAEEAGARVASYDGAQLRISATETRVDGVIVTSGARGLEVPVIVGFAHDR